MKEEEIKFDSDNTYNVKMNYVLNPVKEEETLKSYFDEWLFLANTSQGLKMPIDYVIGDEHKRIILHDCKLSEYKVNDEGHNLTFNFTYN